MEKQSSGLHVRRLREPRRSGVSLRRGQDAGLLAQVMGRGPQKCDVALGYHPARTTQLPFQTNIPIVHWPFQPCPANTEAVNSGGTSAALVICLCGNPHRLFLCLVPRKHVSATFGLRHMTLGDCSNHTLRMAAVDPAVVSTPYNYDTCSLTAKHLQGSNLRQLIGGICILLIGRAESS